MGIAGCTVETGSDQTQNTRGDTPTKTSTPEYTETDYSDDETSEKEVDYSDDGPELRHLHGITGQTYPPDIQGNYHRRFEWSAVGYDWWYELKIPKSLGEYYNARFGRSPNYSTYVTDAYGDQYITSLANEFERMGNEYGLSKPEVVNLAVGFVQGLNYTKDAVTHGFDQYSSYPVETLIERGGDCEDSSFLLAAILREMGYGCLLLGLWNTEPEAHMAVGVKGDSSIPGTYYEYNGDRYYYVETTESGREIGEMPNWGGSTDAEFILIKRHPTLVYNYETSVDGGRVAVDTSIANFGRKTAISPSFIAELEDKSGQVRAQSQTRLDSLKYEEQTSERLLLEPQNSDTLRLNTYIMVDGGIHDVDRSEWRRPV